MIVRLAVIVIALVVVAWVVGKLLRDWRR